MNERCERVREELPVFAAGGLGTGRRAAVEAHLAECAECAAESRLVDLLFAGRPAPPPSLVDDVKRAVRARPRMATRPWWGLAAAAVAAVALGIGVLSPEADPTVELPAFVASEEGDALWLGEDGMIAGAPALDALSDEALAALLEELSEGGAA